MLRISLQVRLRATPSAQDDTGEAKHPYGYASLTENRYSNGGTIFLHDNTVFLMDERWRIVGIGQSDEGIE